MVAQILADARHVHDRLYPRRLQLVGRADARSKQDARRSDRACAEHDFGAACQPLGRAVLDHIDAGDAPAFDCQIEHLDA
jgi:hypothetical protein